MNKKHLLALIASLTFIAACGQQAEDATRWYDELAVYNFNGPGYAMFRKDILERAGSG